MLRDEVMPSEFFEYQPAENDDWDYARNLRSVLMAPSAEWVQSLYSQQFHFRGRNLLAPNRDFAYEGLLSYQNGENWKFIDCIALSFQNYDQKPLAIVAGAVKITPWKVIYSYRIPEISGENIEGIPFFVSYYLHSQASPNQSTGEVDIFFPHGLIYDGLKINLSIQPFIDIRHMYSSSNFDNYQLINEYADHKQVHISNYDRQLTFYLPDGDLTVFETPQVMDWRYKLGVGSRIEAFDPHHQKKGTIFEEENKNIGAFFDLRFPPASGSRSFRLFFTCCLSSDSRKMRLPDLESIAEESRRKDQQQLHNIRNSFPFSDDLEFRDAIWARIVGLTKFKTYAPTAQAQEHILCPVAGAWWFRTPWYRDVFEGILNSFETLMKLPSEMASLREIISMALRYQDDATGLISTRIPEFNKFELFLNSTDATLLCFIAASKYIQRTGDVRLGFEVLSHLSKTISRFCGSHCEDSEFRRVDGPPRVDQETGLLLSAPHHSWTDTRNQSVHYAGWTMQNLPNRVSAKFVKDLYDKIANKEKVEAVLSSPEFFLPEINAQWIVMLKGAIATLDLVIGQYVEEERQGPPAEQLSKVLQDLLLRAKRSYKTIFWNENNDFIYNLVYSDRVTRDGMESEAGVTSAALLGTDIFNSEELCSIWDCVRKSLLVYRKPVKYGKDCLPFGIITKNDDMRIFYNDCQYHSDVVWLKSSPYLLKLLLLLDERDLIKDILINTLDHQMTEAAVFYNQEVFSKPLGNNPNPNRETGRNPVPVKNPIQYWSQWCDAFIDYYGERRIENGD